MAKILCVIFQAQPQAITEALPGRSLGKVCPLTSDLVHSQCTAILEGIVVKVSGPSANHALTHSCTPSPGASICRPLYQGPFPDISAETSS